MAQATIQLEKRLARVERELADLKKRLTAANGTPWYEQIIGSFKGDPMFRKIVQYGREIRQGKRKAVIDA